MTNPTIPENGLDVSGLKPCAFCGSRACYYDDPSVPGKADFIECSDCGCVMHGDGSSVGDMTRLIAAWNRRFPPADNAVAVKRLIWEAQNVDSTFYIGVAPMSGEYRVKFNGMEWEAVRGIILIDIFATADEAKAAAQANYETRIRSALEPTPSYAEGRAAALVAELLSTLHRPAPDTKPNYWHVTAGKHVRFGEIVSAIEALIGAAL